MYNEHWGNVVYKEDNGRQHTVVRRTTVQLGNVRAMYGQGGIIQWPKMEE